MLTTGRLVIFLVLLVSITHSMPSIKCAKYLLQLRAFYQTSKGLFFKEIAPYMLFSGKQLDDMGFAKMCKDNNYSYTTVKIDAYVTDQHVTQHPDFLYSFYYGFCFSNLCSVNDLNEDGRFIIENIFKDEAVKFQTMTFYNVDLEKQFSPAAFIICLLIIFWFFMTMVGPLSKWFKQCISSKDTDTQVSIPLQQGYKKQSKQQIQSYSQPIKNQFFKSISIGYKYHQLWTPQQSTKIKQFSIFKILTIPLITYGYYFYLCNHGAFNIFSFNSEIYKEFYTNVATFTYYIPDMFFFISGFLFTKKVFTQIEYTTENNMMFLLKCLGGKILRLYPIYIVALIIYAVVVPPIHYGPMWMIHEESVKTCSYVWWRNILMIDNFWQDGCFEFAWWVQVEVQYTLLSLGTFALLFYKKSIGTIILYMQLLASWVLLFTITQKLPIELQVTTCPSSQYYFKSFHSHLPFYLTGVILALIFKKQSSRRLVIKHYFKNTILLLVVIALAIVSLLLVLFRPVIFSYDLLGFELGLCRTGVLFAFVVYCLPAFVKEIAKKTIVHKLADLTYPIILVSGIIVNASFWGLQTFPYVSDQNILYSMFPNLFLSIAVGTGLHLLFNFSRQKSLETRVI